MGNFKTKDGVAAWRHLKVASVTLAELSENLSRPVPWITGVQSRFSLPVPRESFSPAYAAFLRKILHLRLLGVSEGALRDLWTTEIRLLKLLHLNPHDSPTWFLDECVAPQDLKTRLLLSNVRLGNILLNSLQIGLNFAGKKGERELFDGREMGEDALRMLGSYRDQLAPILRIIASEAPLLKEALTWGRKLI